MFRMFAFMMTLISIIYNFASNFSVGGGELLRHVVCEESFDEPLASRIVKQTLHALAYLHTHNIVHMDVKVGTTLQFVHEMLVQGCKTDHVS